METISSITTVARKSVFGENATATQSGTEPPTGDAPGKGTPDVPYDPGNVPEQVPTESGVEPPSGGPPGKGTADAPFDRGNEPEQVQITGGITNTTSATDSVPSNTTPANNPDHSNPSEIKAAVASNDASNPTSTTKLPNDTASYDTESNPQPTSTVKPSSHSALFGLGKKEDGGASDTIHPPKSSRELTGTIAEAAEVMNEQAEKESKGATEDDTGGYVGLKKAAMEEEEKRRNGGASEGTGWAPGAAVTAGEREPRSIEKKDSLGREISPGEMPDGTHRKSIAEGMPQGHHFGRKNTGGNGEKSGGFRDRLKDKFRSKK
ncbi:hypothetical protein EPUS_08726 [Endocarpon pusillum Z07020]|uniref:Uncharacterized protein n=1 Tax=Endocarpon pusillum (strain Z07020 / HMAS-L-300199) TaxID=1263415 RepID=U1GL07_ENDPU|nr:uncharacterized protein EPUS_08726 [Endocarpon pusillum Z07020]ERF72898.1 hypothetical protein EPUS_08726 [Endocarpon pusillum Z07020]